MTEAEAEVRSARLDLGAQQVEVHFVVFRYPTELAAGSAWERCDRSPKSDLFSVFHFKEPDVGSVVVALSEDRPPVAAARRLLRSGGVGHEVSQDLLRALYLRRVRATLAAGPTAGPAYQRARYGRGGAVLGKEGEVRPRKRPLG
jgi:hypothetical protein